MTVKANARGTVPRFLSVPRVDNFAASSREYQPTPQFNVNGIQVGASKADVQAFATWPLTPISLSNYVAILTRQQQG